MLNYFGQEIDLCGSDTLKMSNKERTRWISSGSTFRSLDMIVQGIEIKVVHPQDLIDYKKELDGDHQQVDIEAIQRFLNEPQ